VNIPDDLKYTKEHEWLKVNGNTAIVGITDYAQGELGDIVFVELPAAGIEIEQMKPFGTIEAVKAVSEVFAPVTGKITEINQELENDPMIINRDPYGEGWMVKIEASDKKELESLLSADDYRKLIE
jgi:glycine cleavage system H protein